MQLQALQSTTFQVASAVGIIWDKTLITPALFSRYLGVGRCQGQVDSIFKAFCLSVRGSTYVWADKCEADRRQKRTSSEFSKESPNNKNWKELQEYT